MARRWRPRKEPKKPFAEAFGRILTWERRVCYSTVTTSFTVANVCDWLYPPGALKVLREAFELTQESHPDRTEELTLPAPYLRSGHFALRIDCDDGRLCTPRAGLACANPETDNWGIVEAMFEYERIHREWEVVTEVAHWFNDHATVGAARYYFPAMGNFLDREHPFHQVTSHKFAPPKRSIGEIAHKIRAAAETVAMATFCPHKEKDRTGLYLTIHDEDGTPSSQVFYF